MEILITLFTVFLFIIGFIICLALISLPIIIPIHILVSISQIKKTQREQTIKMEEIRQAILITDSKREPQEPKERWPYTPPAE